MCTRERIQHGSGNEGVSGPASSLMPFLTSAQGGQRAAAHGNMTDPDPEPVTSRAGHRLGAPETLGISTLDPAHRPPAMPAGRHVTIRVHMLDDTEELFDVSVKASGKVLFDLVCRHMNLIEGDYFGLECQSHQKMMVWLDPIKPIIKQLSCPKHTVLRFAVKYFPPDHAQLLEDLTRYLFALQIKQDLSSGHLTCNDTSAALMVSHIMQSEIGDFEEGQCRSHLLNNKYIPDQMPLIDKIMEFHSMNVGQTPAESDFQLLEVARRLEMYGIRLHPAKDREGSRLSLAVAHTGVLVFQGHTKINSFNWSKIRKLSFKRKRFLIKLRADGNSTYQDTLEFLMANRDCCKAFWKICVEYHAFFRLFEEPKPKPKPVLFTRGSSFRFSGRTQKQVIDFVRESEFKKLPFERKHSRVQHNSRLSPLPSPHYQKVPKESGALGDRVDAPSQHQWKESALVSSQETPEAPASPAQQNSGHEDRSPSGKEETRGSARPTHLEQLATGSAFQGGCFSTCSEKDSNVGMDLVGWTQSYMQQVAFQHASDSRSMNGPVEVHQEEFQGSMKYRKHSSPSEPSHVMIPEMGVPAMLRPRSRVKHSSSPVMFQHGTGSPVAPTSPVMGTFCPSGFISHAEQNGYASTEATVIRSHRSRKHHKAKHRPHANPNPATSFPGRESQPVLSHAERMAALERRMLANGLSAPGKTKAGPGRKRQTGLAHAGAVQMSEGCNTSASESSESEVEVNRGDGNSQLACGDHVEATSAIPRNKFSFGSLQLDEEADEDACHTFSDDESFQIING